MSAPSPFAFDLPRGLRAADVKTSLIGWGAFMILLGGYCTLYDVVVLDAPPDPAGSILWIVREWAVWWFITPVALKTLRQFESRSERRLLVYLCLGAAILTVSIAFRAGVDQLTDARGIGTILIVYTPRYFATVLALVLVWHFLLRRQPAAETPVPSSAPSRTRSPAGEPGRYAETLLVSKGRDSRPIRVERIECISAAGNYVEIKSGDQRYLMRTTMKELEQSLPRSLFIRVHRSHIVNLNAIDRIKSRPSGNGTVVLRCGTTVDMSKSYRQRLRKSRPPAH
ncbi:MAG TPA: LytTR family DNA-binding domain-containing protein [Woeseiaceae bacterium]|jgi:hypothetical protein|nr:LytTR family DNA-binding domain-containing protein [Woeseiaceae bacterium]